MSKSDPVTVERLEFLVAAHPGLVLEGDRETFRAEAGDLDSFAERHAEDAHALVMCVYANRKIGLFDQAVITAERAMAIVRSFETVSAAATVQRVLGNLDAALELFDEAAAIDSSDTSALMESAKMLGEAERFPEAEQRFARVVQRDRLTLMPSCGEFFPATPLLRPAMRGTSRAWCGL